jgi:hypothetical protein
VAAASLIFVTTQKPGGIFLANFLIFSILFLISGTQLNIKERGTGGDRGTKGD